MIIKDLLISNNEKYFINKVLIELCKKNISYVYIQEANELHFDKYIIRFIIKDNINNYNKSNTLKYDDLLFDIFDIANKKDTSNYIINEPIELIDFDKLNEKEKYKFNLKMQNQITKMNLKNNDSKNFKTLKKQLNPIRKIYK